MAGARKEGEGSSRGKARLASTFYEQARRAARVVKPHEVPWEEYGQLRKKDLVKAVKPVFHSLDASSGGFGGRWGWGRFWGSSLRGGASSFRWNGRST